MDYFTLDIPKDFSFAKLKIDIHKGLKIEDILSALKKEGVVYGINRELIERLISSKNPLWHTVAESKPPLEPIDDKVSFLINLDTRPVEVGNRVDYREKNYLKDITKLQKVMRFIPGSSGVDGKGVDGKPIPYQKRRESIKISNIIDNSNINFKKLSSGEFICYSTIDGSYYLDDGKLFIVDHFELEDDLDYKTGNLSSTHISITIYGDIKSLFKLSGKDLVVKGKIYNGSIVGRSLHFTHILKGDQLIKCEKIFGKEIQAREKIYAIKGRVTNIHNCDMGVFQLDAVKVMFGKLFIKDRLVVESIGSPNGGTTKIVMGIDKERFDNLHQKRMELSKVRGLGRNLRYETVKCSNEISELRNAHRKGDLDHDSYYAKFSPLENELTLLKKDLQESEAKESKIMELIEGLESSLRVNEDSYIEAKKIYPGTIIRFGYYKPIIIYKEYENVKIYYNDGVKILDLGEK